MAKSDALFWNYKKSYKLWAVFWIFAAGSCWFIWFGWDIMLTHGMREADGGILKPLWQRMLFGLSVMGIGVLILWGMYFYLSIYALELSRHERSATLVTMAPIGYKKHELSVEDVGGSTYYSGNIDRSGTHGEFRSALGEMSVDAPWVTFRVRGYRIPFILDAKAEIIKIGEIKRLAQENAESNSG